MLEKSFPAGVKIRSYHGNGLKQLNGRILCKVFSGLHLCHSHICHAQSHELSDFESCRNVFRIFLRPFLRKLALCWGFRPARSNIFR